MGETNNSIINMSGFAKPATVLLEKIGQAVGGLFAPFQIKRVAKAEAEAAIIKAKADIHITDLHRRAVHRWVEEEAQKQKNIEDVTHLALPKIQECATPSAMQDDWVTSFFDKARLISDQQMQELWARVLAGEANSPGTFSKRTVNILGDLDRSDAEMFQKLCGFVCWFPTPIPTILDFAEADIYRHHGVTVEVLSHLDSLGLLVYHGLSFQSDNLPKVTDVSYFGKTFSLTLPDPKNDMLDTGVAMFTKSGRELAQICKGSPVAGFIEYLQENWKQYLVGSPG